MLTNEQIGSIELKQDCAFVAVQASAVKKLLPLIDNSKLKNKKVRITII